MSSTKASRVADPNAKSISLDVHPYTTHTVVTLSVASRGPAGVHRARLATWYVRLTRADLAGHTTDDVLRVVLERILHRLESGADPADYQASAIGPGAPLGATGGTVTPTVRTVVEPTLDNGAWGPEKPSTLT